METRQGRNILSKYEESEEEGSFDSDSSERPKYESISQKVSSKEEESNEESPQSRAGVADTIATAQVSRPSNALSNSPIQVVYHLNSPKHALIDVFSHKQLSQMGLQTLAQADLLASNVTPDTLSALLLTFPKLNDKELTIEHLSRAMGMLKIPIPLPESKFNSLEYRFCMRRTSNRITSRVHMSPKDFLHTTFLFFDEDFGGLGSLFTFAWIMRYVLLSMQLFAISISYHTAQSSGGQD
ncbi:hypothetical protein L7F22_031398 [Adiantum nelumboides]|nr:hypothetical protein [Adiantum nelumboides]